MIIILVLLDVANHELAKENPGALGETTQDKWACGSMKDVRPLFVFSRSSLIGSNNFVDNPASRARNKELAMRDYSTNLRVSVR